MKNILNKKVYNALVKVYGTAKSILAKEPDNSLEYPFHLELIEGKLVCLDLIPSGSIVIAGGVGNDIKFEHELIKRKNATIIGIDPTSIAEKFVEEKKLTYPELQKKYVYVKKALSDTNTQLKLYYGENDFMSSVSAQHRDTKEANYFYCDAITIDELLRQYPNVSYLKLDIEGAEYGILNKLDSISVPQISIEFHHHCSTEYSLTDTINLIQKISKMGYDVVDYGAFHGAGRKLPAHVSKWSDLNCELLFIKQ